MSLANLTDQELADKLKAVLIEAKDVADEAQSRACTANNVPLAIDLKAVLRDILAAQQNGMRAALHLPASTTITMGGS